jgi:hypothetical protein
MLVRPAKIPPSSPAAFFRIFPWVMALSFGVAGGLAFQAPGAFEKAREQMVAEAIVGAGIKNPRVIEAMRRTPRHEFVPPEQRHLAYYDMALPIGFGQTISPPFVVAFMTEALDPQPTDRVLEVGTGSGYQAAVLSPLVKEVYTIEIVEPLARRAAETLARLGYKNVFVKAGRWIPRLAGKGPLRQNNRHLFSGRSSPAPGGPASGGGAAGDPGGRAISANPLFIPERGRKTDTRSLATGFVCANDRQSGGGTASPAGSDTSELGQWRFRGALGRHRTVNWVALPATFGSSSGWRAQWGNVHPLQEHGAGSNGSGIARLWNRWPAGSPHSTPSMAEGGEPSAGSYRHGTTGNGDPLLWRESRGGRHRLFWSVFRNLPLDPAIGHPPSTRTSPRSHYPHWTPGCHWDPGRGCHPA